MKFDFKNIGELSLLQLREIAEIDIEIPTEFDPYHIPSDDMIEGRLNCYSNLKNSDFFKAVYDSNMLVGFHIVHKVEPDSARIITLWVRQEFPSKGIAKELKAQGLDWAKKNQVKTIYTTVNPNNRRMQEINKGAGFEVTAIEMRLRI